MPRLLMNRRRIRSSSLQLELTVLMVTVLMVALLDRGCSDEVRGIEEMENTRALYLFHRTKYARLLHLHITK